MREAVEEVRFIVMVLESIGIQVTTPIIVKVDKVGAIFMAENVSATSCTKHIDTSYHFVRKFVEDCFIKELFVKTAENKSDMFTKNISGEAYDDHIDSYIMDRNNISHNG
jgi:hypothetical protein